MMTNVKITIAEPEKPTIMLKPDEDPLSPHALLELRLFSTSIFVVAAIAMQIFLTLETASLLKLFSYQFDYSLFSLKYVDQTSEPWTEGMVCFVFGTGPLLLSVGGLWFLSAMGDSSFTSWKSNLMVTWLAFLMVNALPCGFLAGVFFFDNVGVAFQWMFMTSYVRAIIAGAIMLFMISCNGFWLFQFLKTARHPVLIESSDNRWIYIKNVFIKPWIWGTLILLFFNWPYYSLYWPTFLLSLGYLGINAFTQLRAVPDLKITISDDRIFTRRFQTLYVVIGLALVWFLNYAILNF